LVNKTNEEITNLEFRLINKGGVIKVVGEIPNIPKMEMTKGALFIEMEIPELKGRKNKLHLELYSNGKLIDKLNTNFLGPIK